MIAMTPGARFRAALEEEKPLQVPGAICAYHATLAKASGFKAIYLSGGGVASACAPRRRWRGTAESRSSP